MAAIWLLLSPQFGTAAIDVLCTCHWPTWHNIHCASSLGPFWLAELGQRRNGMGKVCGLSGGEGPLPWSLRPAGVETPQLHFSHVCTYQLGWSPGSFPGISVSSYYGLPHHTRAGGFLPFSISATICATAYLSTKVVQHGIPTTVNVTDVNKTA